MKYSEQWIKEWVPITVSTAELCNQLTNAGLEVDGTEGVAEEFSGVVVARVVAVEPHPNAARLSVCQVDDGAGTSTVVCGAPNVRPGLLSAFARVGAVLPGGSEIGRSDLRGIVSEGMLLSTRELGLDADADGILELDADHECGTDLRVALGLDDVVIDIDLTPNRGDALSIRGLAREVGVLNQLAVSAPGSTTFKRTRRPSSASRSRTMPAVPGILDASSRGSTSADPRPGGCANVCAARGYARSTRRWT